MLNLPLKMHARRGSMHLSISSGRSSAAFSPSSASLSPRFPPARHALLGPTPPASPALPSLLPRHGKKQPPAAQWRYLRVVATFGACLVLGWLALHAFAGRNAYRTPTEDHPQYEMVADVSLPDEPAAIIVADEDGKARWTVSIPRSYDFPLRPAQYREICKQSDEMSMHISDLGAASKSRKRHLNYYTADPNFIDVHEAQAQGLLTRPMQEEPSGREVCQRTLTYVLETADAGLGSSLMGLWMAYGLAKKERRTFFVDDTRWPYGRYTTYFKAAPAAGCVAPPNSQRLPCPHSAAHLVVSAATFSHTFGHQFHEEFEDPKKMGVMREEPIFALARTGFEDLFHLADEDDTKYVSGRRVDMAQTRAEGGLTIGMHVRRGDRHPWEFQFNKDYLPLTRYADEAKQVLREEYGEGDDEQLEQEEGAGPATRMKKRSATSILSAARVQAEASIPVLKRAKATATLAKRQKAAGRLASKLLLASDDPDVYDMPEVSGTERAQDRVMLASKTALEAAADDGGHAKNKYIDEIHGWEGGFFRNIFWGLGHEDDNAAAAAAASDDEPSEAALALRAMVGKAYLLDLAVLAEADAVVCGVSAMGCRLLAVMKSWDAAIAQKRWRNVDAPMSFDWTGIEW